MGLAAEVADFEDGFEARFGEWDAPTDQMTGGSSSANWPCATALWWSPARSSQDSPAPGGRDLEQPLRPRGLLRPRGMGATPEIIAGWRW